MQLEKADVSAHLALGLRPVEVFKAKGRDGKTDIWGVVCRPRNLNPGKRYPVIENIYAGPQDSFVPKNFISYNTTYDWFKLVLLLRSIKLFSIKLTIGTIIKK